MVGLSPRAGPSPPLTRPPHEDPHGCPGAARPVAPISLWTCGQQRVAGHGRVGGRVAPAPGPAQRQALAAPRGVPSVASAVGSEGAPWHCGPAPCAAATRPPTQPSCGRGDTGGCGPAPAPSAQPLGNLGLPTWGHRVGSRSGAAPLLGGLHPSRPDTGSGDTRRTQPACSRTPFSMWSMGRRTEDPLAPEPHLRSWEVASEDTQASGVSL